VDNVQVIIVGEVELRVLYGDSVIFLVGLPALALPDLVFDRAKRLGAIATHTDLLTTR